jgi:hypothetical protein
LKEDIVPKQIYRILTNLTGERRFDMALHLATRDLLKLKLQEIERKIKAFEKRYHMSFGDFKKAWGEGKIADKHSYGVEKDYWDWEASVTNKERLKGMLDLLI